MEFGPWIAGYLDNLSSVNARGGGRHDVLQRLTRLIELAKQYGISVILTGWGVPGQFLVRGRPKIRAK